MDILDGHFSPSMPIGLDVVRQLRVKTKLLFNAHIMVTNNEYVVREMIDLGVEQLCFHIESAFHVDRLLTVIKDSGVQAGVALMPGTPLNVLDYVLDRCDFVLLMLINPGYASNKAEQQVPYAVRKVAQCREYLDSRRPGIQLEVDGRVSFENIPELVAAGADILVAGSSCLFHSGADITHNLEQTREAIAAGLRSQ